MPEVVSRWSDALRHWDPDPDYFEFEVEIVKRQVPVDPEAVASAERSLEVVRKMSELAHEIRRQRRRHMFELAAWTVRLLQEAGGEPRLLDALQTFAPRSGSDEERVDAASSAIDADRLSKWITFSLPSRRAHFIGTDKLVVDAFVVTTVMRQTPGSPPAFAGAEWVREREQALVDAAEALRPWGLWPTLVEDGRVDDRINEFIASVQQAAAEARRAERQALVSASTDPARLAEFTRWVRDGYDDARLVPLLLAGPVEPLPRENVPSPRFLGVDEWVPKDWFLSSNRMVNVDDVARHFGEATARDETDALLRALAAAPVRRLLGSPRERVDAAVQRLRDAGFSPNVVMSPISWRLRQELGVGPIAADDAALEGLGQRARHWVAGRIDGLVVVDWPTWPADRVVVADTQRSVQFNQTIVEPEEEPLVVAVQFFSQEEAVDLAKEHRKLFWTDERRTTEARAEEVAAHGYLRIRTAAVIKVAKLEAAVAIRLPRALHGE
jgi:hypothetical protein